MFRAVRPGIAIFRSRIFKNVIRTRITSAIKTEIHIVKDPFPFHYISFTAPLLEVIRRPVAIIGKQLRVHIVKVIININLRCDISIIFIDIESVRFKPIHKGRVIN